MIVRTNSGSGAFNSSKHPNHPVGELPVDLRSGTQPSAEPADGIGRKKRFDALVALPLGILGLSLCSSVAFAATPQCGFPDSGVRSPAGAYLWQSCTTGLWRFAATGANGSEKTYVGSVTSSANFTRVTKSKLESGDSVQGNTSSSIINYSLSPGSGADEFQFKLANNASGCFTVEGSTNSTVYVGSNKVAKSGSFDLGDFGACDGGNSSSGNGVPTANISPTNMITGEEAGTINFSVQLSNSYSKPVTVNYKTRQANANNAATAGDDFVEFSDSVVIPAGQTSATITATVVDDSVVESKERFHMLLKSATNAELGDVVSFVDILDNDSSGGGGTPPPDPEPDTGDIDVADPGPYAYMNDADPVNNAQMLPGTVDPTAGMGYPRIGLADSPIAQSVEQLTKYHMIAAQNISKAGKVQKINPDVIFLRQVNPVEFQLTVKQAMPFNGTGSATVGSNVYAGHWVYKPGTRLTQSISTSTTTIPVEDTSHIEAGSYAVIYDAPAGSFNNAEHVKIKSVNKSAGTITVQTRGYKSTARSHGKNSILAQHVTGGGLKANAENWVYNQSTACPLDSRGNTFGEAMVDWLATHYDTHNNGNAVDVRVDGFHFDTDRHYMLAGEHADVDNDLIEDVGVDNSGYNMWGEGMKRFYADLRNALPDMIIVGGGTGARGWEDLNGVQWEGFPVAGDAFSPTPSYKDVDAQLANYGLHVRDHHVGPLFTQALNKSPTKLYPYLEPSHRTNGSVPVPSNNRAFRFSFGLALMDDGFYGQPSSGDHDDVWWDEYAVDVRPGSSTFGHAMASNPNNESKIRQHTEWMGQPLGERVRVYAEAAFAKNKSLVSNGSFDSNLVGWSGTNVSISADSNSKVEGTRSLRISKHQSYANKPPQAQVLGETVSLQAGVEYTFAFAVKASKPRQLNVAIGNSSTQTFLVPDHWVRRVMTFTATKSGSHRIKFQVGKDDTQVWLDAIYLFKGNASLFQRDFENARVVVNATPKSRTVNLGGTFRRIKGTGQDSINNGASVSSVTVAPYDAAILVRP